MKTRVLILCTGNSARSQMAEGLLRAMAGEHVEVFSAGTRPVGVNPAAIEVMREIGIDISGHRSKSVDEFVNDRFDYVITVCDSANEACPYFAGAEHRIHRGFSDPAAEPPETRLEAFRKVRDEISEWLRGFCTETLGISVARVDVR